jgi:hypothetical protein
MTKPANFPGRVKRRRIRALARFVRSPEKALELETLTMRAAWPGECVKTKKFRGTKRTP